LAKVIWKIFFAEANKASRKEIEKATNNPDQKFPGIGN
jgi:hypothetical protein